MEELEGIRIFTTSTADPAPHASIVVTAMDMKTHVSATAKGEREPESVVRQRALDELAKRLGKKP